MSTETALFALLFLVTNAVQTITGFAGGVLAMPFAMALVGREIAAGQINLLGLFLSLFVALQERRLIVWRQVACILPVMGLGLLAGGVLQRHLSFDLVYTLYGGFILLSVLLMVLRRNEKPLSVPVGIILLLLAGTIHRIFVSGGPLLVIYALGKIPNKGNFRATLNAVWVFINALLIWEHWRAGLYTPEFFLLSAVLLPAMLLGMVAGYLLYQKVSPKLFLRLSYGLLSVMGFYIILF